jgi:hypothetical protein
MGYTPGVVMEILLELAKDFNLTYQFVQPIDAEWGALLDNGTWTGAFGQIYRGVNVDRGN